MKKFNKRYTEYIRKISGRIYKIAREFKGQFQELLNEIKEVFPIIGEFLLTNLFLIIKILVFAVAGWIVLQKGYSISYSVLVSQDPLLGYKETVPVQIIAREKETGKILSDIEYNIDLLPITKAQTTAYDILLGSKEDDVLVKIETTEFVDNNVVYEIVWPGKVGFPIAAGLFGDLEGEIIEQAENYTRLKVDNTSSLPREMYSDDYVFFFWQNGKEEINFSDREIRLKLDYSIKFNFIQITFLSAEQIIQEVPLPESLAVNAYYGGVTHYYSGRDLIVIYMEAEKKSEGQYNLIISGILLSAGTTLMLQAVIDLFDLLKNIKLTRLEDQEEY